MTTATTPTKRCCTCKQVLPVTEFYKHRSKKGNLSGYCKRCDAEKVRHYRELHREQIIEREKRYNAVNKAVLAEQKKRYYIANKTEIAQRMRIYQVINASERAEYAKLYNKTHLAEGRARGAKRRAAKRLAIPVGADLSAIKLIYKPAAGEKCFHCGKPITKKCGRHVDHLIPLSKGGLHCAENLVVSCATCNLNKHSKLPHEFGLLALGFGDTREAL